jgi:large subunit ribosomal protein L6
MSRVGNKPIHIPQGVKVDITPTQIKVKGPKGELVQSYEPTIKIKQEGEQIIFERSSDAKRDRALHGLYRALVNNMVIGVTEGYSKRLELVGVGYKVESKGQVLEISIGYSHGVFFIVPKEIQVKTETVKGSNPSITLTGIDKQLLGQVAAKIKSIRGPEPYKGKGIRIIGEYIVRKAGKSAGKGKK